MEVESSPHQDSLPKNPLPHHRAHAIIKLSVIITGISHFFDECLVSLNIISVELLSFWGCGFSICWVQLGLSGVTDGAELRSNVMPSSREKSATDWVRLAFAIRIAL